jgi:hypothetical protein
MKISPVKTAHACYAFVLSHRLECARILWLPLALAFVLATLLLPRIVELLGGACHACVARDGALHNVLPASLLGLLLLIVLVVLASIMCAGLWRYVLRGIPVTTPYYLGFGSDELHLLALTGLKALLLVAWAFCAALLAGLVALVASHLQSSMSFAGLALTALVALLVVAWFGTRLSLAGPATIYSQHLSIGKSWQATAHNVARLQRIAALLVVPTIVVVGVPLIALLFVSLWAWQSPASVHGVSLSELARACSVLLAWLYRLWPLALFLAYFAAMIIAALQIVARALEYQTLASLPGPPI